MIDRLTALAIKARDGDRRALEAFVNETMADVWRFCRYLADATTADDLAQETYERAIPALRRFRGDGSAKSWLLSIARRVCVDATRRSIRQRRLSEKLAPMAGDQAVCLQSWAEVDSMLDHLDVSRREAFVATQLLGLRYDEAAAILDCPVGTIRSRVARARADLLAVENEGESGAL